MIATSLYYFLFGSAIFWSCFLLCELTLSKAVSKIAVYFTIVIYYIAIGALYYFTAFQTMTFIEYIIGFLPFIVIPLLYKDSVAKIVFVFTSGMLFSLMIHLMSNIITNHTFAQVQNMNLIKDLTPDDMFHILTLVLMVLYLIICVTGLRMMFKKMMQSVSSRMINAACIFPVIAFAILLYEYIALSDLTKMNSNVITMITIMVLFLFIYLMLYFSFTSGGTSIIKETESIPSAKKKDKEKQPSQKEDSEQDSADFLTASRHYYEMLLNHYMDMNDRTKNLDTHLQTMNSLLLNDNIAGATVFMDRITQTFHDHDVQPICNNQSVNNLMSYYNYVCQKEHIFLDAHVSLPQDLPIPDLDLCVLFGNCIENAIEANRFLRSGIERFVNVDCKLENGCLMIIIDNPFDGFINKVNNQLKSRKKYGGAGLKAVRVVIRKFQGTIEMEYPQNIFSIYLKLQLFKQKGTTQITNNQPMVQASIPIRK